MTTAIIDQPVEDTLLTKIAALLRHAEKASTEEEAATYTKKAQALATRAQIDLEVARMHGDKNQRKPKLVQEVVEIGQRGKRGLHTYVTLYSAIAGANGVTIDIAHDSTTVYPYGFDTDIEVVNALYTSLVVQMVEASDAYLRSGDHRQETVWRPSRERYNKRTGEWDYTEGGEKPVSGTTARISFQRSFASRIRRRLLTAKLEAEEAAKAADLSAAKLHGDITEEQEEAVLGDVAAQGFDKVRHAAARLGNLPSDSVEMVLVQRELAVRDFYKKSSNARGSYKGGRSGSHSARASSAGRKAGDTARLSPAKAIGGSRTAISS
jgi:hypothetical protein